MHAECFVTGGSGFIGQHLLARLTRQGHPVTVLLRQPQTLPQLQQQIEAARQSQAQRCNSRLRAVRPGWRHYQNHSWWRFTCLVQGRF